MSLDNQHAQRAFETATVKELRTILVLARRCVRTFNTLRGNPTDQNGVRFQQTMAELQAAVGLGGVYAEIRYADQNHQDGLGEKETRPMTPAQRVRGHRYQDPADWEGRE